MSGMHFDASEVVALASRMAGADRIMQTHLVAGVSDSGKYVEGGAKGIAPVVTGHYRRNITSSAQAAAGGAQAIVRASAPYSRYVEYGRGPIVARGKMLRFTVGGRVVYARRVGPARAQHVMKRALDANRGRIRARLQRAGREAANAIIGGAA